MTFTIKSGLRIISSTYISKSVLKVYQSLLNSKPNPNKRKVEIVAKN